jgi:hypothetical protein
MNNIFNEILEETLEEFFVEQDEQKTVRTGAEKFVRGKRKEIKAAGMPGTVVGSVHSADVRDVSFAFFPVFAIGKTHKNEVVKTLTNEKGQYQLTLKPGQWIITTSTKDQTLPQASTVDFYVEASREINVLANKKLDTTMTSFALLDLAGNKNSLTKAACAEKISGLSCRKIHLQSEAALLKAELESQNQVQLGSPQGEPEPEQKTTVDSPEEPNLEPELETEKDSFSKSLQELNSEELIKFYQFN